MGKKSLSALVDITKTLLNIKEMESSHTDVTVNQTANSVQLSVSTTVSTSIPKPSISQTKPVSQIKKRKDSSDNNLQLQCCFD